MSGDKYILGLDTGTTYSAIAYHRQRRRPAPAHDATGIATFDALTIRPKDLNFISRYPSAPASVGGKETLAEVPTELFYSHDGDILYWGYEVSDTMISPIRRPGIVLNRFKLLLDSSERTRTDRGSAAQQLARLQGFRPDIKVQRVIADFLFCLLKHAKSELEVLEGLNDCDEVHLVLTVPGIWDDDARTVMINAAEDAARKAGLGQSSQVFLVHEADAATTFFSADPSLDMKVRR